MANRIETGLRIKGLSGLSGDTNALYVTGNSFINGDVNITGNVNVIGTATTLNTETVQTRDNKILLNYSGTNLTAIGGGIEVLSAKTDGTNVGLTSDINGDWNSNTGLNISGRTSDATANGLKVVNSLGTDNFVVRNDGYSAFMPNGPVKDIYFGNNARIQTSVGGNGFLTQFDLYNCRLSNLLDGNNQSITSLSYLSVGYNLVDSNTKMVVRGSDSSSSNCGLKVQDSGGTNNFVVRNDGNVGIGSPASSNPSARLDISHSQIDYFPLRVISSNSTLTRFPLLNSGGVQTDLQIGNNDGSNSLYLGVLNTSIAYLDNRTSNRFEYRIVGDSKLVIDTSGNVGIGDNFTSPTARLEVRGSGTTSGYGLKVQDSSGTNKLVVRNDGFVGIGTSNWSSGLNSHYFEALSPISVGLGTGRPVTATFYSTNSYAQDNGGGIALGGKYNTGGDYTPFGGINAVKRNVTDGDYSGRLNLWVRDGSAGVQSFTSLPYGSKVRNGMGTDTPTALLHLDGDNADVFISEAKCINTTGYAGKFYANTVNTQNNIGIYSEVSNGLNNYAAILMGGNVGIGTISPSETLEVNGKTKTINLQVTSGATPGYVLTSDGSGNATWQPISSSSTTINNFYATNIEVTTVESQSVNTSYLNSNSPLYVNSLDQGNIYFGSTSAITIDLTTNRLGIDTINPSEKLEVNGNTKIIGSLSANTIIISGVTVNPKQTIALFFGHDSTGPLDSSTYYIGNSITLAAVTTASDGRRVIMPKTGNIVRVGICSTVGGTLGTSETSTITINNTTQLTQSTITTGRTYDTSSTNISYLLSTPLAVTEGDKVEIRWTTPAWVTNPTAIRQQFNVYLEY